MIEFNMPANKAEALSIIAKMTEGEVIVNKGGDAHRPVEVIALIGTDFLFYTKQYCMLAQKRDGLWPHMSFENSAPFWIEHLGSGSMVNINKMSVGAEQLMEAINTLQ